MGATARIPATEHPEPLVMMRGKQSNKLVRNERSTRERLGSSGAENIHMQLAFPPCGIFQYAM